MNLLISNPVNFINGVTPLEAQFIVFCATWLGVITIVWVLIYLLFRPIPDHGIFSPLQHISRRFSNLFFVFVSTLGAYAISVALKNYFKIGRPDLLNINLHPLLKLTDYGFPSSHATFYMALATALFCINRRAGIFAGLIALVIGAARIMAGVHTPLDIIGGCLLGVLFVVILDSFAEKVLS